MGIWKPKRAQTNREYNLPFLFSSDIISKFANAKKLAEKL